MSGASRATRLLTLAAYLALLAVVIARYAWLAPPARVPVWLALLLSAGPLLLPARGIVYGQPYTHAWTAFLALPYFALGFDAVIAGVQPAGLGWATVVASLGLFAGAVGYARCRGRELRRAAGL